MRRVVSFLLTLSLVATFVTPRLHPSPAGALDAESVAEAPLDAEGRGFLSVIGCVGCLGGGLVILSNGLTATQIGRAHV